MSGDQINVRLGVDSDRAPNVAELQVKFETRTVVEPKLDVRHQPVTETRELTWGIDSRYFWVRPSNPEELQGYVRLDDAVDLDVLDELLPLLKRWHLSSLTAGCVHQVPVYTDTGAYDLDAVPPCPESGYRFGSAWLADPLPPDVEVQVRELLGRVRL